MICSRSALRRFLRSLVTTILTIMVLITMPGFDGMDLGDAEGEESRIFFTFPMATRRLLACWFGHWSRI